MPPPPPPSKSYLLHFTDSDLDSDDSDDENDRGKASSEHTTIDADASVLAEGVTTATTTDDSPASSSLNKRKKKKKKAKKKKKTAANTASSDAAAATTAAATTAAQTQPRQPPQRRVQFTNVRIRSYARTFYSDGVPSDGGWPLGLSVDIFEDSVEPTTVDAYESAKQARLSERYQALKFKDPPLTAPFETRQWDFKFSPKNPLFRTVPEKTRMHLILGTEEPTPAKPKEASPNSPRRTTRSQARHNSHNERHHSRSSSRNSFQEQPSDNFDARHVQQELEVLRTARTKQDARGCVCRKLHVYIPPPSAGRKAAHRRLKPAVVKEELRQRNALPEPQGTRESLEQLLAELVVAEPCCGEDCPCSAAEIACQSDACGCWKAAAHHLPASTTKPTPDEQVARCGSRYGMVTVDFDTIDAYRKPFYTCRPCRKTVEDSDSEQEEKKTETV